MYIVLIFITVIAALTHFVVGTRFFTPQEVISAFSKQNGEAYTILSTIRLPRTIVVILAGSSLSIAGFLSQTLTKNPIATPQILGMNSLVVLVAILIQIFVPVISFLTPLVAIIAVFCLALCIAFLHYQSSQSITQISLIGMAFNLVFMSISQMIMFVNEEYQEQFFFWLVGGVNHATWSTVFSLIPYFVVSIFIIIFYARSIDMLKFDEEMLQTLGVSTTKIQFIVILAIALFVVGVVSLCGPIAFVGLVVPHFVKRLKKQRFLVNIFLNAICGSLFLLIADIVAKVLFFPQEVYLGVISAMIGSLLFFLILLQIERGTYK